MSTPIVVALDWDLPFELMCDASDYAIGAVLGQKRERTFQVIVTTLRRCDVAGIQLTRFFWI